MAKAKKPAAKSGKTTATEGAGSKTNAAAADAKTTSSASKAAAAKPTVKATSKPVATKPATTATPAPETPKSAPTEIKKDTPAGTKPADKAASKPEPVTDKTLNQADKPKPAVTPAPAPQQEERQSIFLPLVIGGLVAGAIGLAAGQYNWFGLQSGNNALAASIETQDKRLGVLENAEPVTPDLSALDTMATKVTALSETIAAFEARLKIVEERPAADGGPSIAENTAFERELLALKTAAEEQRAEIATLLSNAQSVEQATADAAKSAQIQAAVSQITTAISGGQPFADTIATLSDNGVTDIPAALADVAADGVVTLNNLQSRFPDSARAALGVARTSGAMEGESGVGGFLKRQLGARSTAPREGADPDAILSRAEAAVRDGGLDAALGELDALPQDVQSAMQDWLDDARARNAAQLATQDLSQSLTAN